jgi:hypothetical protein
MTKKTRFFATMAAIAAIGFSLAGCDSPTNNNNDIPGHNQPDGPGNDGGNQPGDNQPGNGQPRTFTVTFDSAGGSAVASQIVAEDGPIQVPSTTRAWVTATAGLWAGSELPRAAYTLVEWRHEGQAWNFETGTVTGNMTLTAYWVPPTQIPTPIAEVDPHDIAAVIAFVGDPDNKGAFTLAIGEDVNSGQNILNQPNTDLTIIGIGGMRRIQFSTEVDNERLFYLDGDTISLTLGNNITLAGRSGSTVDLVRVMNAARLYMKEGSKITEHSTTSWGAVEIRNGSVFTMSGGTITGNTSTATGTNVPSGVFVTSASSRFYMTGGSISGNHRGGGAVPSDVSVSQAVDYFTMSGNAAIYGLILGSNTDGTSNAVITVDGWTGIVSRLDLRVNTTTAGQAAVIWAANPASPILQAAESRTLSLDDVGRLLSVYSIGNAENLRQPIAHEIVLANGNTIAVLSE